MSVAKRVGDEMDVSSHRQVGYSIRFEDMTEPEGSQDHGHVGDARYAQIQGVLNC
ncbi:hypothetical protein BGW80DRAFT_1458369 [Lactifluus volemus]|nr:hypothetical protein BGW80DRAFT_1458369 [Lactifluus volemus]